jgi:putative solute:sodium symporter small subunit
MSTLNKKRYWRRVQQLTAALLTVWLLANLMGAWFARDMNGFLLFGSPVRSWVVAQAGVVFYLLIIVIYLWAMERLEARYQADEVDDNAAADTTQAPAL